MPRPRAPAARYKRCGTCPRASGTSPHRFAQAEDDAAGAWVHAHLHRVEGDLRNAGHWYRRAGKAPATGPLGQEWDEIAAALTD